MRLLVLGVSTLFRNRVLPALAQVPRLRELHLASRRGAAAARDLPDPPAGLAVTWHRDYARALDEAAADLVYISTENSAHENWVEEALRCGLHVAVDKPACLDPAAARRLAALARAKERVLAEATVWPWHPLAHTALDCRREFGPPLALQAGLSFPPLPPENFRNRRAAGGGAVNDLGAYAVSAGRLFFEADPAGAVAEVSSRGPEVETGFHLMLRYGGGRALFGHFGFDTEYHNHLTVLGPDYLLHLPRAFTPPAGQVLALTVRRRNHEEIRPLPAGHPFAGFLNEVLDSLGAADGHRWGERLVRDAEALDLIRRALA